MLKNIIKMNSGVPGIQTQVSKTAFTSTLINLESLEKLMSK